MHDTMLISQQTVFSVIDGESAILLRLLCIGNIHSKEKRLFLDHKKNQFWGRSVLFNRIHVTFPLAEEYFWNYSNNGEDHLGFHYMVRLYIYLSF